MKNDYFWWDLEDSEFKGLLYDSMGMYFLGEYGYKSWDEFVKNDPHMAYAHLVYIRFHRFEQQFVDLRVIPQMLGVENLPLDSSVRNINRHDWLKGIIDLSLFRFSSIRDIAFHFVNQVLELGIENRKLNLKKFKKELEVSHPKVVQNLQKINNAGSSLRNDRNDRAHEGFIDLFTQDNEIFKSMSWLEGAYVSKDYDLVAVYQSSRDKVYDLVIHEVEKILETSIELVDELCDSYRDTFEQKSNISKQGIQWSQHFYLHQK